MKMGVGLRSLGYFTIRVEVSMGWSVNGLNRLATNYMIYLSKRPFCYSIPCLDPTSSKQWVSNFWLKETTRAFEGNILHVIQMCWVCMDPNNTLCSIRTLNSSTCPRYAESKKGVRPWPFVTCNMSLFIQSSLISSFVANSSSTSRTSLNIFATLPALLG